MSAPTTLTTAVTTTGGADVVAFRLADPAGVHTAVRLWSDLELGDTTFERVDGGWAFELPIGGQAAVAIDRIEYLLDVDGEMVLDPGNPLVVPGAFGDHSWLPLRGYSPPAWLDVEPVEAVRVPLSLEDTAVGVLDAEIWAPADANANEPLPLLISHDGPEMDAYGELTRFVGAGIAAGVLPRMRVALLAPGARDERYAANPAYAAALVDDVLPALAELAPSEQKPVLIGQSLGALAALHAAWIAPDAFAGVFAQSGSFFTADLDPQESDYAHFAEVTDFVRALLDQTRIQLPGVAIGCGLAEENLANNKLLRGHLRSTGLHVEWTQVRDGHTWTCWRDMLDPGLTDLLHTVWS